MKYGIAMFPSKALQDIVNSYRKRYDPHYALIPPHITLKYPFEMDDEKVKQVVKEIKQIAQSLPPIEIKVRKVSSFHPVNNVLYFKVEDNANLNTLQNKLNEDKLEDNRDYSFVPHITIGQQLSDEEHADVLQSLNMKDIHHDEVIDRFQLLYQLENGSWTVYETFHLGKEE